MQTLIDTVVADAAADRNPYFVALQAGTFERDDFVATQVQFYFAVDFFSRPMAAVAAKIPSARQRREILRNVWEEHGEGATHDQHGTTFLEFLHRLAALTPAEVDQHVLWPEVRMFNTTLTGAAVMDDYLVGTGMLGMIERLFADISGWIGRAVVAQGWLPAERMIHYHLHEQLDVKHAADFFAVLQPAWDDGNAEARYAIAQGLRLGATVFMALYEGLWRGRKRRWRVDA